jgi:DNA repair exonuclease SbcCD ATPase subunit
MRIHRVELEHVRQIKRVAIDFSHPLSIIGGRNGIGKTAIQEAILTAMFDRKKEDRESLVSRFDPDSPPTATLHLSRGEAQATICLRRTLTDRSGEWIEGPIRIKAKGEALKKVQESLPMSAEAAALLLWGRQNELAAVVREFPPDGHSLLTAATIKGSGPDPKEAIKNLEDQIKDAKRGGQHPGPLTRAQQRVKTLEAELHEAQQSLSQLGRLQEQYREARSGRDRLSQEREQAEREVRQLERLQTAVDAALRAMDEADRLEKQRTEWEGADDEIRRHQRTVTEVRDELRQLESQYRVALDASLADQADRLLVRLRLAEEADAKCRKLREELESRPRPDARELKLLDQYQNQQSDALNRLDATGLRYELSATTAGKTVELAEDNAPARQITLAPNQIHENIVGSVVIRVDDLRLVARGKEDVSSLKRAADRAEREIAALLARFQADDEQAFRRLAEERGRIANACTNADVDLKKHLRDDTLESLRAEVASIEKRRAANRVAEEDREAWSRTILAPAAQIEKLVYGKQVELDKESKTLKQQEGRRPTESQQQQLQADLRQRRGAAQAAGEMFAEQSPGSPAPSKQLLDTIRGQSAKARARLDELNQKQRQADVQVERLSGELKHAGPKRPIGSIEVDLEDARADLLREETLQKARELLSERIAEKIQEMSESVPRELAARIGQHLARLSGGAYAQVSLNEAFAVDKVGEGGDRAEHWQPHELSAGEQALTALVMKIAVARALAEAGNPVFVLLDDSLVNLDPQHRAATEALLVDLIADGRLQVILLTCHSDWALDWQNRCGDKVQYIDLAGQAEYYRTPPALV